MLFSSHRTLLKALTVSLLIHVVIMLDEVGWIPVPPDMPAAKFNVVMSSGNRLEPAGAAAVPERKKELESSRPIISSPRHKVVNSEPSIVNSPPAPRASTTLTGPLAEIGTAVAEKSPVGLNAAVGSGSASTISVSQDGFSPDDMRQYRLSLATAARRFKRYPALARERGWEGTAEVALAIKVSSSVPEVVMVRSSGRDILDEQALEMVSQAARSTLLPEGLRGRNFRLVLPVKFSLDENR